MLVYQMTWSDGIICEFDFNYYSLQEMRELRDEVTASTHGALTAQIDLMEVDRS